MNRAGRRPGVSVAEAMIATVILAMGLLPLFATLQGAIGQVKVSRPAFIASLVAGEVMDQMRLAPLGALQRGADNALLVKLVRGQPPPAVHIDAARRIPLVLGTYPADLELKILVEPLRPPEVMARVLIAVSYTNPQRQPPAPETFELSEWVVSRLADREKL